MASPAAAEAPPVEELDELALAEKKAARKASNEAKAAKKAANAALRAEKEAKKAAEAGAKKKETALGLSVTREADFGNWYVNLCVEAELMSYYNAVGGCYVLRPDGYAVWESVQAWLDPEIKKMGVRNCYFPLFVTEESLRREAADIEAWDELPEVAWVTRSGNEDLQVPVALRPTSEAVMYPFFSNWVQNHRDLPLKLNQWTNVVRWETNTCTPFIRSREFLWQEGHTAHVTKEEADKQVLAALGLYEQVYQDLMAVPVVRGYKSKKEQFVGSLYTTTVEAFIPGSGRAVQGATSHALGQNFAKMFGVDYETAEAGGARALAWQTSWGCTTRTVGVMIMTHGDNKGMVMPPRMAPTQLVLIPIVNSKMSDEGRAAMMAKVEELRASLAEGGVRCIADTEEVHTPGWKYNHWEVKGVPIRLELGPKDMEKEQLVLCRRDTGKKDFVAWSDVVAHAVKLLDTIQSDMYVAAREKFDACIETVRTWAEFEAVLERKHMCFTPWADEVDIEVAVKEKSKTPTASGAKTLCIPLEQPELAEGEVCFFSGKPAKNWVLWGRSY